MSVEPIPVQIEQYTKSLSTPQFYLPFTHNSHEYILWKLQELEHIKSIRVLKVSSTILNQ